MRMKMVCDDRTLSDYKKYVTWIDLHLPKKIHPNCEVRAKPYPSNWGVIYSAIRFIKIAAHDSVGFLIRLPEIGFRGDLTV